MTSRRRGRIINLSSGSVLGPTPAFSAYPVSKTAVTRLTEHLALDTSEYGVSVFVITPGLVYTPLARQTFESPDGLKWTARYGDVYQERHDRTDLASLRDAVAKLPTARRRRSPAGDQERTRRST
jgi:NAD(P)-dependent dehydrogenase (short-subunit alcohol dehydrogenase family)